MLAAGCLLYTVEFHNNVSCGGYEQQL